jgi:flagellar M-ring protein FliF
MRTRLSSSAGQLRSVVSEFTAGQKLVAAVAVIGVLLGSVFFVSWATTPTLAPLYSNLGGEDASAIVERLGADGVPYELADGGATIMVPREQVYDLRLRMSGEGLPAGDATGYAILDEQGLTTSEFQQHIEYRRALEGELSRTVAAIDGVETAVVHLAIPRRSVFVTEQDQPTASVLVQTRPGATLSAAQVQAVVHLVASSVEGLAPESVTVADSAGTVLAQPGEDGMVAAAGDVRAQQTLAYEQRVASEVEEMLARVVGAGKAVVRVSADLDFDRRETTSERYVEEDGVPPLAETTRTETYEGTGAAVGGVLGPENEEVPVADGAESTYESESSTRNNAVGRVQEESRSAPGAVQRLSVAVLLDTQSAGTVDIGEVRELVATAVGLDEERGDEVAVTRMAFDQTAAEEAQEALAQAREQEERAELFALLRTAGLVVLVVLGLIVGLRATRRPKAVGLDPAERALLEDLRRRSELPSSNVREIEPAGTPSLEAAPTTSPTALPPRDNVRAEVRELVEQQPDEVAALLRSWLADRRS